MLADMIGQLGNGLVLGAVIAVASVGLSLIFGVTESSISRTETW